MNPSKPPIVRPTRVLPFDQLPWDDFERLCLRLLPREGFENPQHYGAGGGEQGRDIVAHRDGELWYVQCKQVKRCGPKVLLDEIEKVQGLMEEDPDLRPVGMLFMVSCDVSATARDRAGKHCKDLGLTFEVWGPTELDALVQKQKHSDIVKTFFGWPIGIPFQAQLLPAHFVPRPEVTEDVKDCLLSEDPVTPGVLVISAIHGLGGIGKSVLAAALAHDADVQRRFPDGVLWATLGQRPDIHSLLADWIQALGDYEFHPMLPESASAHLRTLLHGKACLLVLDDAWQADHMSAFLVGGERCRVLITTRDAEIARELGAKILRVRVMTSAEAITLLERWADGNLDDTDHELKLRIVSRLGCLPLALKLAGALLQRKTPAEWLQTFDIRKLKSRRPETIRDSLELTFGCSLDALDPSTRNLYIALAIFRKGEDIREAEISLLWKAIGGLNSEETTELVSDLNDRALLERYDGLSSTIVLHDLLHEFIDAELGDARITTHRALLDAYRPSCTGSGWHTANDDGYLYDHLAYHLREAELADELKTLFADQKWLHVRFEQHNRTYDAYLDDVRLAWESAEAAAMRQIEANEDPVAFADCIRYGLIRTSINNISGDYVSELVARAVETGLWTPGRALSVATRTPDALHRERMCIAILKTGELSNGQREEAVRVGIEAAASIREFRSSAHGIACGDALATLASYSMPVSLQHRALAAILELDEFWHTSEFSGRLGRADVLARAAPHFAETVLTRALEVVPGFGLKVSRAIAFTELALNLEGGKQDGVLKQAFEAALELEEGVRREEALRKLIRCLTAKISHHSPQAVLALANEKTRAETLAALTPPISEILRRNRTDTALELEWYKASMETLVAQCPALPEDLLAQSLEIALAFVQEKDRVQALRTVTRHLTTQALLARGLEGALVIQNADLRIEALATLIPHLSEKQRGNALRAGLDTAGSIEDEFQHVRALATLIPFLPQEQLGDVLRAGLETTETIEDEKTRVKAVAMLIPHLTGDRKTQLLERALETALGIEDEFGRAEALIALAPCLTGALLEQAIESALSMEDNSFRVRPVNVAGLQLHLPGAMAIAGLAPYLPPALKQRALEHALARFSQRVGRLSQPGFWVYHIEPLEAIEPHLSEDCVAGDPEKAVEMALEMENEDDRTWSLARLAPYLSGRLLLHALRDISPTAPDQRHCVKALTTLAPYLPEAQQVSILTEGIKVVETIGLEGFNNRIAREESLLFLAPHLLGIMLQHDLSQMKFFERFFETEIGPTVETEEFLEHMLDVVRDVAAAWALASILSPYLPTGLLCEAIDAFLILRHETDPLDKLKGRLNWQGQWDTELNERLSWTAIRAWTSMRFLQKDLESALTMEDKRSREGALIDLVLQSGARGGPSINGWYHTRSQLQLLGPLLVQDNGTHTLEQGLEDFSQDRTDWLYSGAALAASSRYLTGTLLERGLEIALARVGRGEDVNAFAALAMLAPKLNNAQRDEVLQQGLAAAQALQDREARAEALAALAAELDEDKRGLAIQQGLDAARAIEEDVSRAKTLAAFLPVEPDQWPLLQAIRQTMIEHLPSLREGPRQGVLEFCATTSLFAPPILSPQTLGAIADNIVDICLRWEWA